MFSSATKDIEKNKSLNQLKPFDYLLKDISEECFYFSVNINGDLKFH